MEEEEEEESVQDLLNGVQLIGRLDTKSFHVESRDGEETGPELERISDCLFWRANVTRRVSLITLLYIREYGGSLANYRELLSAVDIGRRRSAPITSARSARDYRVAVHKINRVGSASV